MTKRSELIVEQPYYETVSGQYFWTPDGVGCYWYDTLHELEFDLGHNDLDVEVISIEKLEG